MEISSIVPPEVKKINPYENSAAVQTLKERKEKNLPLRLAIFDIDSTMTGASEKIINLVREKLHKQGFVVVFNTSRPEEMVASARQQRLSGENFLRRPAKYDEQDLSVKIVKPPEEVNPWGILDPEVISGTGNNILVLQRDGGYLVDDEFKDEKTGINDDEWREDTLKIVEIINAQGERPICKNIAMGEEEQRYFAGEANVYPLNYRIQTNFKDV